MSAIDLTTGYNVFYQAQSNSDDRTYIFEEVYRFIESFNPKEILINTSKLIGHIMTIDQLLLKFNFNNRIYHIKHDEVDPIFFKISFQNELLSKVFTNTGLLSPIEYINMEQKIYALLSFIILLEFSYEHNEKILVGIHKPKFIENDKYMQLINNALINLNIISNSTNKISSVVNLWSQVLEMPTHQYI